MDKIERHLLNMEAEMEYDLKVQEDKELREIVIVDEETGLTIRGRDYNKQIYYTEGLEDCSKGFIKKPYKGRKPGERN